MNAFTLLKADHEKVAGIFGLEVMSNQLDKEWWSNYRTQLQKEFRQEELLIWASDVTKL